MGRRGPAPTPTKILETRGSWRAKTRSGEPRPEPGKPVCPKHLTKDQRAVWARLCKVLDDMGVLTVADGSQLERYVVYYCRWRACEKFIDANGMSYALKSADPLFYVGKLPNGEAVVRFLEYPQVKESHRLDAALKQIEAQFGLTPAARTRLTVGGDETTGDPFEELLSNGGSTN